MIAAAALGPAGAFVLFLALLGLAAVVKAIKQQLER